VRNRLMTPLRLTLGLVLAGVVSTAVAAPAQAAGTEPYAWRNAPVVAGGFVPGIIYNPSEAGLVYARTDIGGAYRMDPTTKRWIPLTDWVGSADYNLLGAESLATDPVDPNRVYIAAGEYVQSWAANGAILSSTDKGATWARVDLPFKIGGNEPGRSIGERLVVDPNSNNVLYLGTRNDGLWKSTDFGATWARVASFPVTGRPNLGVGWVTFDKATGTAGSPTQTIYAGVIDSVTPVYRSTDGGATWAPLAAQPSAGIPHHAGLATNGTLYLTYGDQPGPYTMNSGAVWKLNTTTGAWTDITPLKPNTGTEGAFGYAGLAVDPNNPGTVMAATMGRWGPGDDIFRSVNGGSTWFSITAKKVMDVSASPWLNFGSTPKLGWMIGSLQIDPFNSKAAMYGTGATIYASKNITNAEAGLGTNWLVRANGLEETAVNDLMSPPSGPPLVSALGDIGVFVHTDLTASPASGMALNPRFNSATSVDFAEKTPTFMVRAGYADSGVKHVAYSTNSGSTWTPVGAEPSSPQGAGYVAASADGTRIVWSPESTGTYYSTNRGTNWTASTGLPAAGLEVTSDRMNAAKFYATSNGSFYVSSNGAASFAATAAALPTDAKYVATVPGREGDIWVAGRGGGLYHSTDSGSSFTQVSTVGKAETIGFGKAAPGKTYQALYLDGTVDGVPGIFRSDDTGATWVRINDDAHQYGWTGKAIAGDPRVYGRVYVSTNGRGILVADKIGNDFSLSTSTPSGSVNKGLSTTTTVNTSVKSGSAETVSLSVAGLPTGATATLSPTSVAAGGSSTLTVKTASTTPSGTYAITVKGTAPSASQTATYMLWVKGTTGIVNGGLDSALTGWGITGSVTKVSSPVKSGTGAARAGNTSPSTDSTMVQMFTPPSGATKVSFYYRMTCQDSVAYDWFTATLTNNTSGATSTIRSKVCSTDSAYQLVTSPVTAGQNYTLTLTNHDDNYAGEASYTYVDAVTTS
jgi:xyloglucan-specific exo-beta-1,4-glucanase